MFEGIKEKFSSFVKKNFSDDMPLMLDDERNYGFLVADVAKAEDVHPEVVHRLKERWEAIGIPCTEFTALRDRVHVHKASYLNSLSASTAQEPSFSQALHLPALNR